MLTASWGQIPASLYSWVYLHQGGRYDGETGLYDFRNRFYDPEKGRWLNLDPIGFDAGDSNLYRYVGNNPSNEVDPPGTGDASEIKQGTLKYYEYVGWIDWNHANSVSAEKLIKEIKKALDQGPSRLDRVIASDFNGGGGPRVAVPKELVKSGYVKIDFQTPASDWVRKLAYPTVTYLIKADIKDHELVPVALAIYMDYHSIFETWQEATRSLHGHLSGHSQEDLFSNLIGFYRAVDPELKKMNAEQIAGKYFGDAATEAEALALMRELGGDLGLRANKSYSWTRPVLHNEKIPRFKDSKARLPVFIEPLGIKPAPQKEGLWWRAEPSPNEWLNKLRRRAEIETARMEK